MPGFPRRPRAKLTAMVNRELLRNDAGLSWDFTGGRRRILRLPGSMAPIESLDLTATAGRRRDPERRDATAP